MGFRYPLVPSLVPPQMPPKIGKLNKIELKKPVNRGFLGFRALGNSFSRNTVREQCRKKNYLLMFIVVIIYYLDIIYILVYI